MLKKYYERLVVIHTSLQKHTLIPNHQLNLKSPQLIIILILEDNHNETVNYLTKMNITNQTVQGPSLHAGRTV